MQKPNYKRIFITTLILMIPVIALVIVNFQTIQDFLTPTTNTGIITSTPNPKDVAAGNAIHNLTTALPVTTSAFAINSYDYAKGKFMVKGFYPGTDLQKAFDTWYQNSTYTAIPKSMFLLTK